MSETICKLYPPAYCEFIDFIADQYQICNNVAVKCPYRFILKDDTNG